MVFPGLIRQPVAEIRMCQAYHGTHAIRHVEFFEVYTAVFGGNILHFRSRRGYCGSRRECERDFTLPLTVFYKLGRKGYY